MFKMQEIRSWLRLSCLLTVVCGAVVCVVPAAAQQPQSPVAELVDSAQNEGVDLFSDTTAVDTGAQSVVAVPQDADIDDFDGGFAPGLFAGALLLFSFLGLLILLGIVFFPLIVLLLLFFFVYRRNRKRRREQEEEVSDDMAGKAGLADDRFSDLHDMKKKLHRSKDRVFAGVCGGLAEYFGFDVTLVRVIYAVLTFFTAFSGVFFYLVLWLVMPDVSKRP